MRRLWIALGLLILVFSGSMAHSQYLERITHQMSDHLSAAQDYATENQWEDAMARTSEAHQIWQENDIYLHVSLRHSDTDEITESFQGMEELLSCQDLSQYSAANARLLTQIYLLWEGERLSWKNIF